MWKQSSCNAVLIDVKLLPLSGCKVYDSPLRRICISSTQRQALRGRGCCTAPPTNSKRPFIKDQCVRTEPLAGCVLQFFMSFLLFYSSPTALINFTPVRRGQLVCGVSLCRCSSLQKKNVHTAVTVYFTGFTSMTRNATQFFYLSFEVLVSAFVDDHSDHIIHAIK